MRKLQVKILYAIQALKCINNPHLGDKVKYKGIDCSLIQGVRNPYWNLLPLTEENLAKNKRDVYRDVHVNDFELQPLRKRFRFSFMFTYKFLMQNWYSIDIRKKGEISYPMAK
jgi:hypothetical protein